MTEAELKTLIKTTLNVPVKDDNTVTVFPSATVECYREDPGTSGDGHVSAWVRSVQVDLWYRSKSDRDTAVTTMTEALASQRICVVSVEKNYDTSARVYRATYQLELI